jgi:NADH:ubiquinone oxidoreductase subunit F (NADH-binding)
VTGEMADLTGDTEALRPDGRVEHGTLPRVLPSARIPDLGVHQRQYGPTRLRGPALTEETEKAGLTGRGGAAYPTGRKLRSVRERAGRRGSVVIANGMESEPASAKDASLLALAPHLVLDGIALAAEAAGARSAYLCVRRQAQADALTLAIAERAGHDRVPVELAVVPERYVASAETALVRYLNGGPALPDFTPPRPFERGVRGRPTLVSNVETLANLALISRHGAGWFRSVGTRTAPGSALVTVTGAVRDPGVYEIAFGTPLREVLGLAGGCSGLGGVQAVLTGGFFGRWLSGETALGAPAAPDALRAVGASFGAGIFLVLPAGACGLAETARVVRYLAGQSAGQCGPCLHGLPAMAETLEQVAFGTGRKANEQALRWLRELCGLVEGRGACHLPDGVAMLTRSALRAFADHVRAHQGAACPAARGYPTFGIGSGTSHPAGQSAPGGR